MANPKKPAPFPTKDQIVEFIRGSSSPVGKREIARAFHIKGDDRVPLKRILKEIKAEGHFEPVAQRRLARPDALPEFVVLEITGITTDGDVTARPVVWERATPAPQIFVLADDRKTLVYRAGLRSRWSPPCPERSVEALRSARRDC